MGFRRVSLALLVCVLAAAMAAAEPLAEKIAVTWPDGTAGFAALTNTGTINAANKVYSRANLPDDAKVTALDAIFSGAAEAGSLVPTTAKEGEWCFALDPVSGHFVQVQLTFADAALPSGSTEWAKWTIPGGLH